MSLKCIFPFFIGSSSNLPLYTSVKKQSSVSSYTEFSCFWCNYTSCVITNIKRHVRLHTGERPFKCEVCDKRFNEKASLKTHQLLVHGNKAWQKTHL